MTEEQRQYLVSRLHRLRSKQKRAGLFRQIGIQRSIDGIKEQLKTNIWNHPFSQKKEIQ